MLGCEGEGSCYHGTSFYYFSGGVFVGVAAVIIVLDTVSVAMVSNIDDFWMKALLYSSMLERSCGCGD